MDCDGLPVTGCETDIRNNPAHCGACMNAACATGALCINSACSGALALESPASGAAKPVSGPLYAGMNGLASLAVDGSDVPYVGFPIDFHDNSQNNWGYVQITKRTGDNTWTSAASISAGSSTDATPALARGPSGQICYTVSDVTKSMYPLIFGCIGNSTVSTLVPAQPEQPLSLVVDPLGTPIIAYSTDLDLRVHYMTDDLVDTGHRP
jgi:hypothetical protein